MWNHTFYPDKMKQYTVRQEVMITEIQANSLKIIKSKGVNIYQFIRQAIKEKLQRDWKEIKIKHKRKIDNAPDWLYDN
jgi:TRAP-type C4-dicarboxylate transport system substrate-binding protein